MMLRLLPLCLIVYPRYLAVVFRIRMSPYNRLSNDGHRNIFTNINNDGSSDMQSHIGNIG